MIPERCQEDAQIPGYCQIVRFKDQSGNVKELVFPRALDLNRPKRPRTTFNSYQLEVLEARFSDSQYMVGKERCTLAKQLGLTETQVKVWFQNRRTKAKKQNSTQTDHKSDDKEQDYTPLPGPTTLSMSSAELPQFSLHRDTTHMPTLYSRPPMLLSHFQSQSPSFLKSCFLPVN